MPWYSTCSSTATSSTTNCYVTVTGSTSSTASTWISPHWYTTSTACNTSTTSSTFYLATSPVYSAAAAPDHHAHLQMEAQRQELEEHTKKAKKRAEKLLLEHLTPEQRKTFKDNKWFVVEGGLSKQKYRIRDKGNLVANIDVMQDEAVTHRLCGHCEAGDIPLHDHLLAQKVMLELAEDDFLKIANRHAA